ncbi:MAG: M20/M25/M40 family metallo-hydrolase, partial [Phycisphaerae bacterium]|nr:M20/M25/M40 family metallo-hydrolase [Phycisphaerae bacterium]
MPVGPARPIGRNGSTGVSGHPATCCGQLRQHGTSPAGLHRPVERTGSAHTADQTAIPKSTRRRYTLAPDGPEAVSCPFKGDCTTANPRADMTIQPSRIAEDIDAIASFTATPGAGCSRPTFSPHWAAARDYVIEQAHHAGCVCRTDAAGNVHVRPSGLSWSQPAWLSGSHLDTVPHGGRFDGVVGVVVPLEILRAARDAHRPVPLELVIFAEEEGTTFGLGMLGSRAWCGLVNAQQLAQSCNEAGESYLTAGKPYGVDPDALESQKMNPSRYIGMVEVHVEQGPAMWRAGIPVALVT